MYESKLTRALGYVPDWETIEETLESLTSRKVTNACFFALRRSRINSYAFGRFCLSTRRVITVPLPGGECLMTETSKSPKAVIASVRGMGVAVITRQCGVVCFRNCARCSTPNLCCSSIITRPSF